MKITVTIASDTEGILPSNIELVLPETFYVVAGDLNSDTVTPLSKSILKSALIADLFNAIAVAPENGTPQIVSGIAEFINQL